MRLTKNNANHGINISGYYYKDEDCFEIVTVLNFEDDLDFADNYEYRGNVIRFDKITSNLKLKGNKWFNLTCVVDLYELNEYDKIKIYIEGERIRHIDNNREYDGVKSKVLDTTLASKYGWKSKISFRKAILQTYKDLEKNYRSIRDN